MRWHWFRKHEHHPCQVVFIPTDTETNGEVWCNTHEDFYLSSPDDLVLVGTGRLHVEQYDGIPGKVLVYV